MFIDFLFELRKEGLKISSHEWLALAEAMELDLHESSLDGFYRLARTVCVKDVADYDAFDRARFAEELRQLETRHRALWDEYKRVWLATNRPLNLNHIGPVWTSVSDGLGSLADNIQNGTFPPDASKVAPTPK